MNHKLEVLVELYKRGDYSCLGLFEKQIKALESLRDDSINEVLYGGGSRGGKSWLLNLWQIMNRLSMPESYGLIAREELTKLKDTTQKTFFKVAKSLGLERDVDYKFNAQSNTVEFSNGSSIFFREIKYIPSDPEFDRLGSYDLTDAALDEAQQIHWKAREVLRGRLSVLRGEGWKVVPKGFYSCNPAKNWIYTSFVRPQKDGIIDDDKIFIPSLATDNPHVEPEYLENLAKADKVTRERLLYGNFEYDDDPSAMCTYDRIMDIFTNDHVRQGRRRISADLAMQGRDRFVAGHWKGLIAHVDIDMPKSSGKTIEVSLKELKIREQVANSDIVADADGLGSYLESYIENIVPFHGNKRAFNDKYSNVKTECAFKLAELINKAEIKVVCSLEQRERIATEISICLKRDKIDADHQKIQLISKDKMKTALGRSPDYLDFLLMGMWFHIKPEYETVL